MSLGVYVQRVSDQRLYVLAVSVPGVHVRGGGGCPVTSYLKRFYHKGRSNSRTNSHYTSMCIGIINMPNLVSYLLRPSF